MNDTLNYQKEVYRKFVHLSSSIFPLLLYLIGKKNFIMYIIPILIFCIALDYSRRHVKMINQLYFYIFGIVTREKELHSPTGATWVFTGIILTVLIFNVKIAIISLLILSFSDSMAAIIGLKFGKTKLFSKSLEGSFAFFLTTSIIMLIFTKLNMVHVFFMSILITISELIKWNLNDNVMIPLTAGLLLYIGGV